MFQSIQRESLTNESEHYQTTLGPQQFFRPSSQAGMIALSSDDLFHPIPGNPISHTFTLHDVPFNPNPHYHAYNRQANTVRPLRPLHSISSSYNNPSFVIPTSSKYFTYSFTE